ncbi:hypothetical protein BC332_29473 [Capsicum chinense]|nr:hypothetical protein BC332_29473 [Capsicum chinense]
MDDFVVLSIILLIFAFVITLIIEFCTDGLRPKEITRGDRPVVASPAFVSVNVYRSIQNNMQSTISGGAKDVRIVVRDGISGKVNTTTATTSVYSSSSCSCDDVKCGICKKAILLESVSVHGGIRANNGGDGDGRVDVTGGVGGGPSHAK